MRRPNDIGGRPGYGSIEVGSQTEEVFHAAWEGRLFGMILATRGNWTIDMFRAARERDDRATYMRRGYFENWLVGFERVLTASGLLGTDGRDRGQATAIPDPATTMSDRGPGRVASGPLPAFFAAPTSYKAARFRVGDTVRAVDREAAGHTRRPGYVRGRCGVIVADQGPYRFPDRSAEGLLEGQQLYTVRFDARELWGHLAEGRSSVLVDLFDDYLEPAR